MLVTSNISLNKDKKYAGWLSPGLMYSTICMFISVKNFLCYEQNSTHVTVAYCSFLPLCRTVT